MSCWQFCAVCTERWNRSHREIIEEEVEPEPEPELEIEIEQNCPSEMAPELSNTPIIPTHISHPQNELITQRRGSIPSFAGTFAPLPRHLNECDLKYLHSQGALSMPSRNLQRVISKAYKDFVHSSMPILDWKDFSAIMENGPEPKTTAEQKPTSLLLFQAVMFAGVRYVPTDILRKEGFANREAALRIFFRRTSVRVPLRQPIINSN